jgi:hypothetical protein
LGGRCWKGWRNRCWVGGVGARCKVTIALIDDDYEEACIGLGLYLVI